MNQDALSTRHRESPLARRSRDIPSPTNNCLEVQWRFLQHKNPKPPQFGSTSRKPLVIDPLKPQIFFNNNAHPSSKPPDSTHSTAPRGSPSRLFHMFETQDVDTEDPNIMNFGQPTPQQESSLPESPRASCTLNDLMGETQRQAMLDRILSDMEYLAVEPTYSRLGQSGDANTNSPRTGHRTRSHKPSILHTAMRKESNPPKNRVQSKQRKFSALWALASQGEFSDDDDDDDSFDGLNGSQTDRAGYDPERKRRQRRKLQQLNPEDGRPRIFWQQTTGARSAADVPERLLTLSPSPPQRMKSARIVLGRRSCTPHKLLSPSTTIDDRHTSPQTTSSPRHRRHNLSSSGRNSNDAAPISPPKAHYGAWYVPHSEWWTLYQTEQQKITEKFPEVVATFSNDTNESHCHGSNTSPTQRQHKPPLPPSALSPRSNENSQTVVTSSSGSGNRIPSVSSRAAPPSAPGPLELQVAGIPQSYIGREYRAYIASTGSSMPQYLQ